MHHLKQRRSKRCGNSSVRKEILADGVLLAKEAKLSAEARGKISDIKQQTISAFENRQTKGISEWVTFVAAAFEDHPTPSVIKNITETKCTEASVKLPTQTELRKMLLGLLAPIEIGSPDS
ncbi:hypothetical protein A254_01872 (plasmid) [Zymomonas mobilis subsp. mobilis NRRL B-12526]|uniref:Uncharacterized protein n=1 Tax=Zymomonas mobilis subsp. mobilis (strain ATCC 31821 / ZM4 / CP4) TaxID=264203 RepID=A0A806CKN1_ZYMMO|nr:hypothetical protein ZZM4_0117 [Zymomonas mobilis subsp. mobilis ZM4 = ATCC 31821]AHB11120.1 hypothetical protein ZCP4_1864 [Zymomonas mobilis subsp. mobilis str. CP4 = NRRL B-14023]AHJ71457.1 hypothetical protein A254_01872 [Zymomonas mobilis subsp. mobilis NRRL B-12526]